MNGKSSEEVLTGVQFDAAIIAYSVKKSEGQTVTEFKVTAPLTAEQTYHLHRLMRTLVTFEITESEIALQAKGGRIPGQTEWVPSELNV